MPFAHRIIFSLLCIVSAITPTDSTTQNTDNNDPIKITPLNISQDSEQNPKILESKRPRKPFHQKENPIFFSEEQIAELESVFKNSPEEAQRIVEHLENPTCSPDRDYRFALFFGDSQSDDKATAAAIAIAYKMYKQGWNCKFLSNKSLFGKNSDHTAIKLRNELKTIETSNQPIIVVCLELNQLLGYGIDTYKDPNETDTLSSLLDNRKHHHPELTNTVFLNFLERQKNNEQFFLIGTMDDIQKLPEPIKHRMIMDIIEFPSNS